MPVQQGRKPPALLDGLLRRKDNPAMAGHDVLIGKTLTAVDLACDKQAIRFTLEGGETIVAKAEGRSCSHTWIENVEMPAGGLPAKVLAATDLDLPSQDKDGDLIQFYGLKLTTDKGDLVLDYRNESNGYYGGNLSWPGEYFYGGVYGQNESVEPWAKTPERT